jgi:hypothetical protein
MSGFLEFYWSKRFCPVHGVTDSKGVCLLLRNSTVIWHCMYGSGYLVLMSILLDVRWGWVGTSAGTWKEGAEVHSKIVFIGAFTELRKTTVSQSQWPRGLRRKSSAARLLRLWVRIPPCMDVCCERCVLSGRGLCDELITRPEESYRLWRVVVCDQEASRKRGG